MELRAEINPGVCGYPATVTAHTDDARNVTFTFECECELIVELDKRIKQISPVDAIQSLSPDENPVLATASALLRTAGCCEACVVPAGAVKAMYVITNLALARDVTLKLT